MNEDTLLAAFTELRGRFIRLASRYLNSKEDADDALQDAFCRLWVKRNSIQSRQEAEAMTATTVKNLCIDRWRKQQAAPFVNMDNVKEQAHVVGVDKSMELNEQFLQIQKIINSKLSEKQRLILQRKEFKGDSLETIANDLGMEQAAVRMQLSRARKTIRECYQKMEK